MAKRNYFNLKLIMLLLYPSPLENLKLLYKKPHGLKGKPGHKHTDEFKKMMSKPKSEEHKKKIAEAVSGNKNWNFGKKEELSQVLD